MSVWWIGVKGNKLVAFEATRVEAFSLDFEMQFGVAFGSYRSQEQAEAGIREHGATLIPQAAKELAERQKRPETTPKPPEKPLRTSKPAQLAGDATWEGKIDAFSLFFRELNVLKVQIRRILEAGVQLKKHLEEKSEDKDKKA